MGRKAQRRTNYRRKGNNSNEQPHLRKNVRIESGLSLIVDPALKITMESTRSKDFPSGDASNGFFCLEEDDEIEEYKSSSDDDLDSFVVEDLKWQISSDQEEAIISEEENELFDEFFQDYIENVDEMIDNMGLLDAINMEEMEFEPIVKDTTPKSEDVQSPQSQPKYKRRPTPKETKQTRVIREAMTTNWKNGGVLEDHEELSDDEIEITEVVTQISTMVEPTSNPANKKSHHSKKGNRKGKRGTNLAQYDVDDLQELDQLLRNFITRDTFNTLPFNPMIKTKRMQLQHLCGVYNLKVQTCGSGKRKYMVASKTRNTKLVTDQESFASLQNIACWGQKTPEPQKNATPSKPKAQGRSQVVGQDARPIDDNNIGNKMLRMMGWNGTNGLGVNEQGSRDPLQVVIKSNRRGLGF